MPPKKVTIKTSASQPSIQILFTRPVKTAAAKAPSIPTLTSENVKIQAFYSSLTPSETIAHTIAVEKLGTSYDVTRTHGYTKWEKSTTIG